MTLVRRALGRRGLPVLGLVGVTGAALLLSACQGSTPTSSAEPAGSGDSSSATPDPAPPVRVSTNIGAAASAVPVSKMVRVSAHHGTLQRVSVRSGKSVVAGELSNDHTSWSATGRLEPAQAYVVQTVARNADGKVRRSTARFHSEALTLDQQTYPSVAPLQGETVGVGMPVIVTFDVPVTNKAAFEKHMTVTSTPAQRGSWRWISDNEAHWRPAKYWKAGTKVSVHVDVNSVPAGNGIYGQEDRDVEFNVGAANIYQVNAQTDQMKVFSNGKLLRTIPITTGKPGFTTRSGTKVIIEKYRTKRMNSETVGIPQGSADAYDIDDVEYAMRVTYSGEFIHAAPWSVGSQGYANVSHGCTGMSTANAGWLYAMSKRGDVVEYTGTDRWMTLTNGYGDWNLSFADYRQGSALH
ncbi:MAG: Ig-like domain-containing protein [Nocardioides sp.]|uniref:L,D-transpeptidase n=1 Tax=Nocardioides sp. TaxID=35761 RepID=UPI0039E28CB8